MATHEVDPKKEYNFFHFCGKVDVLKAAPEEVRLPVYGERLFKCRGAEYFCGIELMDVPAKGVARWGMISLHTLRKGDLFEFGPGQIRFAEVFADKREDVNVIVRIIICKRDVLYMSNNDFPPTFRDIPEYRAFQVAFMAFLRGHDRYRHFPCECAKDLERAANALLNYREMRGEFNPLSKLAHATRARLATA